MQALGKADAILAKAIVLSCITLDGVLNANWISIMSGLREKVVERTPTGLARVRTTREASLRVKDMFGQVVAD